MVWSLFGGVARLLLRRTCAFSLVVVKVLFFPLYRRRAFLCTATHKSKALISLYSFSSNSLSFLVVKVASRRSADFSQTLTLATFTIFSFASYHQQHTNTKKRYITTPRSRARYHKTHSTTHITANDLQRRERELLARE